MDDFWPIERVWAILAALVDRNPRPSHISGVMRCVREAVHELDATTLTKLVHEMPVKIIRIAVLINPKSPPIDPGPAVNPKMMFGAHSNPVSFPVGASL